MSYTIPMFINVEAWEEWCEYRKVETRKKVSPTAAKKQFKFLLNYTEEDQQLIIDHSISNDWTGLFPLKVTPKPADTVKLLLDRDWAKGLTEENLIN